MDLSQVTLAQMRYAVAVEDAGSFRAAASLSHVSQPGLSMQLQKLEELLGVRLFDRTKKPLLVTLDGAKALAQMRTVLRETERLGQMVRDSGEPSGPYRLAVIPTLARVILPAFVPQFVERYPRVELSVEELPTSEVIDRLLKDTLDGAIAATPLHTAGLSERALGVERFFAYLPKGCSLTRKKAVSSADLAKTPLWVMSEGHCFRTQVLSFCGKRPSTSPRPPIAFESGSFETLIALVDEGLGLTLLPELVVAQFSSVKRAKRVRPFTPPEPVREIGFVSARGQLQAAVADALCDSVSAALGSALAPPPRRPELLDPLSA